MESIDDIPQRIIDDLKIRFDTDPKVRDLRHKQTVMQRNGDFLGALDIGKVIDNAFRSLLRKRLEQEAEKARHIEVSLSEFPKERVAAMNEIVLTMELAVDILDTAIMDFNDELHKVDKNLDLKMFDDITNLAKKVKDKMEYFSKRSVIFKWLSFAVKSDNLYAMARSKARSIIRNGGKKKENGNKDNFVH